jgi:hypothetical protein
MGWKFDTAFCGGEEVRLLRPPEEFDWGNLFYIPSFSTQIADAWLVVEKLKQLRPDVGLYDHGWVCTFYGDLVCSADADTAPLAICLSALKAVGVENE